MNIEHILKNKGGQWHSTSPGTPATEAVALMMKHHIGSLVVMEDDELVGIFTERDVLRSVGELDGELARSSVADLMSNEVVSCTPQQGIDEAMELMLHNATGQRIRHLPVLDDGRLAGINSVGDVIESLLTETRFENRLLKSYIKNWPEEE